MFRVFLVLVTFPLLSSVLPVSAQIQWLTWEEAQARNEKEPRKFIVDVYTQWCGWCKKMDKESFGQAEIIKYVNSHYYAVKFDAETRTEIQFKDKVYEFVRSGNAGYHQLAAELTFGKLSYPTLVFLDENLNTLQPLPGYKDPGALDKILRYFAEDYYKTTPWKKYEEMYNSKPPVKSTSVPVQTVKSGN